MRKINAVLIMVIALLSACTPQPSEELILTAIAETEIALATPIPPTQIPTSTSTPTPVSTSTPEPTITPTQPPAFIPGADPVLLVAALDELGIGCTGPTKTESNGYVWVCKDDVVQNDRYLSFYAFFYGKTETSLDQLLVRVVPLTIKESHFFISRLLGYLSTIPYNNSTPDETRLWVETTLQENNSVEKATYEASGVTFALDKNKTGYKLAIGERENIQNATATPEPVAEAESRPSAGDQSKLGKIQIKDGPVSVHDVAYFESNSDWHFMGYLENNDGSPVNFTKIVVVVRDSEGKMLASDHIFSAFDELYKNEKSPFMVTLSKEDAPSWSTYDISVTYNLLLRQAAYKDLQFASVSAAQSTYYTITGEVKNIGDQTASLAKVVGILFDESGKMLGWKYTYADLEKIPPASSSPFELRFSDMLEGKPASYELFVEASIMEDE